MGWWQAIPIAISAASAIYGANSASKQNTGQRGIGIYNSTAQRDITLTNIMSQMAIGKFNAQAAMASAEYSTGAQKKVARHNAAVIQSTVEYNNSLLDYEESLMYEAMDLDLVHLVRDRARERGMMRAQMGASGTVIDDGSNLEVLTDQKTQEALDIFTIRHGADIQASKIANAKASNTWNGDIQAAKIIWESEVGAQVTLNNAALQAQSMLLSSGLAAWAGRKSASIQYGANMYGAQTGYNTNQAKINNQLTSGLFEAAGQGVYTAYKNKSTSSLNTGSLINTSPASGTSGTSLLYSTSGMNYSGR